MLLADALGLLGAAEQGVVFVQIGVELRAEREREGEVERMVPAASIGFRRLVRRLRLVGVPQNPEKLRAIDAFAGERVAVGQQSQPPVPLSVVELVDPIARAARSEEVAAPIVGGDSRTMPDDFEAVVAGLRGGLQELVGAA